MDFLKDIVKEIGDDYTKLASDIDETETYVDTGSYIFNGLVSGSIFGGVSGNKITAIAGESSTGKTFFSLAVVMPVGQRGCPRGKGVAPGALGLPRELWCCPRARGHPPNLGPPTPKTNLAITCNIWPCLGH